MIPYTEEALELFHKGTIALAEVESNGIRIDTEYLDKAIRIMGRKIKYLEEDIMKSEVIKLWKKMFRSKFNIGSNMRSLNFLGKQLPRGLCVALGKTEECKIDWFVVGAFALIIIVGIIIS